MNEALRNSLRQLRLSGLTESLEVRLHEAAASRLSHAEFLEMILHDELLVRNNRLLARRVKAAGFRDLKTLEDFDWHFNPSIPRQQIFELATGRFIHERRDSLWIGAPGLGKSHLVQAVGYHAIKAGFCVLYRSIFDVVRDFLEDEALGAQQKILTRYLKPDLLIIDDMGIKQLPKRSGEYLFEIILRRYETRSTIMTSNRPLEDWGKLIGDVPAATAILDRFLHHAQIITLTGRSYRLRHHGSKPGSDKSTGSSDARKPGGPEPVTTAESAEAALGKPSHGEAGGKATAVTQTTAAASASAAKSTAANNAAKSTAADKAAATPKSVAKKPDSEQSAKAPSQQKPKTQSASLTPKTPKPTDAEQK